MNNWKPQDKKYFGPYQGKSHSEMKEIYSNIKVDWNSIKHRIKKSFSEEEINARKRRYLTGIQEFDSITKGLPSGVTVFIGAEGTGKSLLARNIAVKSKKALYFYCESILDPPDPQIHPNVIPIDYSNPAYIPEYRKAIKQLLLFIEHLNPELVVIDSITKFFSVSKQALPESPLRFAMNDLHSLAIDLCPIICICEERGEGYNRGAAGGKGVLHSCNMEICFYKTFIESESQSLKYQRDINDVAYIMYVNKDKSGLSSLKKYLIFYNGDYSFKQL